MIKEFRHWNYLGLLLLFFIFLKYMYLQIDDLGSMQSTLVQPLLSMDFKLK